MSVRAKFRCTSITHHDNYTPVHNREIKFSAVYGDGKENAAWSKATPSGTITMMVTNPDAEFKVGCEYYLTFDVAVPAQQPVAA